MLLLVGLLACVVMFAVLIPKLSHLSIARPPTTATAPATRPTGTSAVSSLPAPARAARAPRSDHGWLTFGHVLWIVAASFILSVISLAGWLVYIARRRLANRLSRAYGLYEVKLSMHDQTREQDLVAMVEAALNAVREFPEDRGRDGQPYLAFEAHFGAGPKGEMEWVLCVRCERTIAQTIDGIISSAYPDVRVGYEFIGPPKEIGGVLGIPGHVLRFRKDRAFVYPIVGEIETDSSSALETIAQTQSAVGVPSTVRFQLTPCVLAVERYARGRLRQHEGRLAAGDGGVLSTFNRTEMSAATAVQDHAWCWLEVQVAADSRESANRIAAAVQARRGENRLHRRWMILREDLYRRRFPSAYPPVLPGVTLRALASSREVAQLVAFPGARMKNVPMRRLALPRIPAPPEIGMVGEDPQPDLPPVADSADSGASS
jgi:hypothetical protein